MFTGIIEDIGVVISAENGVIQLKTSLADIAIGESVAVNGVCLTVKAIKNNVLSFDYTPETSAVTTLCRLKIRDKVNLERAVKADGRLGGHIVSGHVEVVGKILAITQVGNSHVFKFSLPEIIARYVVAKGSIAIDGISLTVIEAGGKWFTVSVIPHTIANTTLCLRKTGDEVNLEADILARYNEKAGISEKPSRLSSSFLKENGFL
jgi:riboflavin synthase